MQSHDRLWQPFPVGADARLRRWLLDRGSLTRRIQDRCSRFELKMLSQRVAAIDRDELSIMGMRRGESGVVREVSLGCGGQPAVFAHSVAALRARRGAWRMLATLGVRPLGAALFADPRVERFPLRFRLLNSQHELYDSAIQLAGHRPAGLWARRSLFELRGSRLLVTEVFLPAILALAP